MSVANRIGSTRGDAIDAVRYAHHICTVGATLSFTVTYPQPLPAGTEFWKYGSTQANPNPHWYIYPATIDDATVTFTLTDGGLGDDDLVANGVLVDPAGPAVPQGTPVQPALLIPTLDDYGRWLLLILIAAISGVALRRRA